VPELRIENGGVGVYVDVEGPEDAVPVVFLHGVTGSGRTWDWLPANIVRGRRIVRVDLRGHGRSDHAPGTYDVPHYGGDVVAVLERVAARPAVLVGHSLGGVVAWWVAQTHPALVAAALLEDPPLCYNGGAPPPPAFEAAFEALRATVVAGQEAGLSDEEFAERRRRAPADPRGTFGDVMTEDAVVAMGFAHRRMDIGVVDGAIDGSTLAAVDIEAPVSPPVIVIAADDEVGAAFSTEHEARLARTHPAIQVVRVPGTGHGIHDERRFRDVFAGHLEQFLELHAPAE
jgi:pimeloyl-ACP methyl ester carboxylesterase